MCIAKLNRRQALYATALLGAVGFLDLKTALASIPQQGKTPDLTSAEIAAIEAALGKKDTYNQD